MKSGESWACVVPAHHAAATIGDTVRAVRELPGMDTVLVVDDASTDDTAKIAIGMGALVVNHDKQRGRAASYESGVNALGLLEQREGRRPASNLLLAASWLGDDAAWLRSLMDKVPGAADLATAVRRDSDTSAAADIARRGIAELTGWEPSDPLVGLHALTRRTFELASPLAAGEGADVGLLADVAKGGLRVVEVAVDVAPGEPEPTFAALADDARTLADVTRALAARGVSAEAWVPDGRLRDLWRRRPWRRDIGDR